MVASGVHLAAFPVAFNPINAHNWIQALGNFAVLGVCAIIFAETGLMVGFFLPGDSLLFIAGLLTLSGKGTQHLSLPLLLVVVPICAVAGAQLGHWLGARFGRALFNRPDSRLFKRENADKAEQVFTDYGPAKAVILARFIPIVRTFMNPVAGVLHMSARRFLLYNAIGGIVWSDGVLLLGRLVSNAISADNVDTYMLPITGVIVVLSVLPIAWEYRKARAARRRAVDHGLQGRDDTTQRTATDQAG